MTGGHLAAVDSPPCHLSFLFSLETKSIRAFYLLKNIEPLGLTHMQKGLKKVQTPTAGPA